MPRDASLDIAKGIAILAVVVFHVTRGFVAADLIDNTPTLQFWDTVAYGFHIQTFFLIGAYLAWPKAGSLQFQIERQANLYYVYLFWSVSTWLVTYALNRYVNRPVTLDDLWTIPITPIAHFWFLLVLMIGTFLLMFLRSVAALLIGMAVLLGLQHVDVLMWYGVKDFSFLMLVGALLRAGPGLPKPRWYLGLAGFAVLVAYAWQRGSSLAVAPEFRLIAELGGCYACYVAAHAISLRPATGAVIGFLGRHSLAIYLLHVLGAAGARLIIHAIAPGLPVAITVTAAMVCGIVVPLAMERITAALGIDQLVGLRFFALKWPARETEPSSSPDVVSP
jgi:fucose 4-O-acetylase-like acetyltransferase